MKEQCDLNQTPSTGPLHWVGDNFGADTAAVVDAHDDAGQLLHMNVSEAVERMPELDQRGRRRLESGIEVALVQALAAMQDSAREPRKKP